MAFANSKNYSNTGTYQFTKVGDHILVWTAGGNKPEAYTRSCIISSHGCQTVFNNTFTVPEKTSVYFYCPHGYTLIDPDMYRIATGQVAHNGEPIPPNSTCTDYSLSKFQGSHGGGESDSYDKIGTTMHPQYLKALCEEHGMRQDDIKNIQYDIVTIRNRKVGFAPTLKSVISQLRDAGFMYSEIHCSFCRSPAIKSEKGAWNVSSN